MIDRLIWTGSVGLFYNLINKYDSLSKPEILFTTLAHLTIDQPLLTDAQCITNYDSKKSIFRLTLYPNMTLEKSSKSQITVEFLHKNKEGFEIKIPQIMKELKDMNIIPENSSCCMFELTKPIPSFPVITKSYFEELEKNITFLKQFKNTYFFWKRLFS